MGQVDRTTSVSAGRSPVSTDLHVGRRESRECDDNDGGSLGNAMTMMERVYDDMMERVGSLGKTMTMMERVDDDMMERVNDKSLGKATTDWESVVGMAVVKCLFVQYFLINIDFVTKNHLKGPNDREITRQVDRTTSVSAGRSPFFIWLTCRATRVWGRAMTDCESVAGMAVEMMIIMSWRS